MKGRVVQILSKAENFGNQEMNLVVLNMSFVDLNMLILLEFMMLHNIHQNFVE